MSFRVGIDGVILRFVRFVPDFRSCQAVSWQQGPTRMTRNRMTRKAIRHEPQDNPIHHDMNRHGVS